MKAIVWNDETMGAEYVTEEIPAELQKKAEAFHTQLVETVAENDDEILHKFLEGEEITAEELRKSLRKSTIGSEVVPGRCGYGIQEQGRAAAARRGRRLSAFAARYAAETRAQSGQRASTVTRKANDKEPFSALVFKIMADPFVGQLTFIRVYSGQLKSGESVLNSAHAERRSASGVC